MSLVLEAIRRWEEKGLIDQDLAHRLRAEVNESSAAGTQRLFQYVLAATGAVILVIAGGVFLDWAWPLMTPVLRTLLLTAVGIGVHYAGTRIEGAHRWLPASYLMQTAGLALLITALVYSEEAWANMSTGGVVAGALGLLAPVVLGLPTLRRNTVMPAIHLAMGLVFAGVALNRMTPLSVDNIVWVLDGLLLVATAGMIRMLAMDPDGRRYPWALNAFAMSLYAGFILIFATAAAPLGMGEDTFYPMDVWLFMMAGVTAYGIHWAPEGLRRGWFGLQLALCQLAWIPLGFISTVGVISGPPEAALVAVSGAGVVGFLYAKQNRVREILAVSALSFVSGAWYWGVERAGALGAVAALAVTAALLFWISGKDAPEVIDNEG